MPFLHHKPTPPSPVSLGSCQPASLICFPPSTHPAICRSVVQEVWALLQPVPHAHAHLQQTQRGNITGSCNVTKRASSISAHSGRCAQRPYAKNKVRHTHHLLEQYLEGPRLPLRSVSIVYICAKLKLIWIKRALNMRGWKISTSIAHTN